MEPNNQTKIEEQVNTVVPLFEKMLENGFPISVTLTSPGCVQFTLKDKPVDFQPMDLEALKFYINTFMFLSNEPEGST